MGYFKKIFFVLTITICLSTCVAFCDDEIKLIPAGEVIYMQSYLNFPVVEDVLSKTCKTLKNEDVLLSITSKSKGKVSNLEDMRSVMKIENEKIKVEFIRNGKHKTKSMTSDELRLYKLDCISRAIGTVTAVDKNGKFIGLAHELGCVKDNGGFKKIDIYKTNFIQQQKSSKDNIGFLVANDIGGFLGEITSVSEFGVKGNYNNFNYNPNKALPISKPKVGIAYILCSDSITSELKLHKIKITKVNKDLSSIKILDKSLIKFRGGIVRGMSGSPVIQNNKIVGGVRSTSISNPKEGHISNIHSMLGINLN